MTDAQDFIGEAYLKSDVGCVAIDLEKRHTGLEELQFGSALRLGVAPYRNFTESQQPKPT